MSSSAITDAAWWGDTISGVQRLLEAHGELAHERARTFGDLYAGRRAAMVFDVIASRQRDYLKRVKPMVEQFESTEPTLCSLATNGPGDGYGLRSGEADTMQAVAAGLVRYANDHHLAEEEGVRQWAASVEGLEHASRLDPYVGNVRGVGPALFAYLRMRSGVDALKPDGRVEAALKRLGAPVTSDAHELLTVSRVIAAQLKIPLLLLDQLLWWVTD